MSKLKLPKNSRGDFLHVTSICERLCDNGFKLGKLTMVSLIRQHMSALTGRGASFTGTLPHVLTPGFAKAFNSTDFLYSRKLDGVRAMGCKIGKELYLVFRSGEILSTSGVTGPDFTCDFEIVADDTSTVLYVLDVISYNGVKGQNFSPYRLNNVYNVVDSLNPQLLVHVADQYYTSYRNLTRQYEKDWEGIIATRTKGPYHGSILTQVYKYVTPSRLSVDLEVKSGKAYTHDGDVIFSGAMPDGVFEFSIDGEIIRQREKQPNSTRVVTATKECRGFSLAKLTEYLCGSNDNVPKQVNSMEIDYQQPLVLTIDEEEDEEDVNCHSSVVNDCSTTTIVLDEEEETASDIQQRAILKHRHLVKKLLGTMEMYEYYNVKGFEAAKAQFYYIIRRGTYIDACTLEKLLRVSSLTEKVISEMVLDTHCISYCRTMKLAAFLYFVKQLDDIRNRCSVSGSVRAGGGAKAKKASKRRRGRRKRQK